MCCARGVHFPTFSDLDMVLASSEVDTLISGILYYRAAQADEGDTVPLSESLWSAWTFISDPGTHAGEVYISSTMLSPIGGIPRYYHDHGFGNFFFFKICWNF